MAMPEGVARGGPFVTSLYGTIFKKSQDTGVTLWQAVRNTVQREKVLTGNIKFAPFFRGDQ